MLKFNLEEYKESTKAINEHRKTAEEVAKVVNEEGYTNIFFTAVGGSLAPMMALGEMAKQLTDLPVFVEQAAELLVRPNKALSKDSIVITMSKSGDTKETVEIAKWCQENGIRVICLTKNEESPLAQASKFVVPMKHENGVEFEYMLLLWTFLKLVNLHGDFEEYDEFASQLENLPIDLLDVKAGFEDKADEIAKRHYESEYMIWIGGSEVWGETYLFSMCILEEMQWLKTKSVTPSEFFHGTLELVEKDTSVILVKGEGACRVLDDRVEKFVSNYSEKFDIIDPKEFELKHISDQYRWIVAPLVVSTMLVDRLGFHFENYTKHDLDIRRYYRQFDY